MNENLMNKNERIEIKGLMNGYKVERSWRERRIVDVDGLSYDYMDEEYMFKTWDEVVDFVSKNVLEIPPARI